MKSGVSHSQNGLNKGTLGYLKNKGVCVSEKCMLNIRKGTGMLQVREKEVAGIDRDMGILKAVCLRWQDIPQKCP